MAGPIEWSVVFMLGPPHDGWERELFDLYQRGRRESIDDLGREWESYEKKLVSTMFGGENGAPSPMDEAFSSIL
jgi:hypothetical protein